MKRAIAAIVLSVAILLTGCSQTTASSEISEPSSDTTLSVDDGMFTSRDMEKQTGKIVVKFQRRGKPTNSALLESHYQSEHLQDIGISRPICCYTSK